MRPAREPRKPGRLAAFFRRIATVIGFKQYEMYGYEKRTLELLRRAFPHGFQEEEYLATMAILGEHMSMRNLTDVLSMFTNKDHATLANDVYGIASRSLDPVLLERITRRLQDCGLEQWIQQDASISQECASLCTTSIGSPRSKSFPSRPRK